MADLTGPRLNRFDLDVGMYRYPCSSVTAFQGSLMGINPGAATVKIWDDDDDDVFLGIASKNIASGDTTCVIDTRPQIIRGYKGHASGTPTGGITVAGVTAATDANSLVYCSTDNIGEDATLTPGNEAIGRIVEVTDTSNAYATVMLCPLGSSLAKPSSMDGAVDLGSTLAVAGVTTLSGGAVIATSLDINGVALILDVDGDSNLQSSVDDQLDLDLGGAKSLGWKNATAMAFAAATDTVGADCWIQTADAGGTATAARVGGALDIGCGDGSAGAAAVVAGAGGAWTLRGGAGGAASGTAAGGASGAVTVTTGAAGAHTGGGASGAGGAGGAIAVTGVAGGATSNTGSDNGGAGSDVSVTGGAGGAASAGTGDGGAGGIVTVTAGAGGATTGGTAGVAGYINLSSTSVLRTQGAPGAMTASATMTDAQMLGGIITGTHTAGSTQTYTSRTGTEIDTALPGIATNESFELTIINLSAALADTVTIAGGTDVTVVGLATVDSAHVDSEFPSSGTFRFRRSAANTYVAYRIN